MNETYKLKDVVIRTYDGHTIEAEVTGLFNCPRRKVEDMILNKLRPMMKRDIPVAVEFKRVFI